MTAPVTVMVTAYRRIEPALTTLRILHECDPRPAEILVHVDGGERTCAAAIERAFPEIPVIVSEANVGPGGGRNRLVEAARHELVASFDDDSYPMDRDYFARLVDVFRDRREAWVVAARIFHLHQPPEPATARAVWTADFNGCGCAYRRSRYAEAGGYVPLPTAYGMEEVDLSLRVHARGGRVLQSDMLRVCHHTDLSHHADPAITSASIVNIALLAFLRYPPSLWALGAAQCVNRIQWLLRHGRRRGVLSGLTAIPATLTKYRHHRHPLRSESVRAYLALRRRTHPA